MISKWAVGIAAALVGSASVYAQEAGVPSDAMKEGMRKYAAEQAKYNAMPDTPGTGPYPAQTEMDLALPNDTLYRPADLAQLGRKKLGLLIWGNGGCSNDAASARFHLLEIASHGYLVVAPGKTLTGPAAVAGVPAVALMTTTVQDMREALTWALAENDRKGSLFYRRIDPKAIAVSGHSCGGMLAILVAADPRVRAVIIHNSGVFPAIPARPTLLMHEERLQGLHTPVLFVMGGKSDMAWNNGTTAFDQINQVPVMLASMDVGHMGTFVQPNGGAAAQVAVDWLEWQLHGDKKAAQTFEGKDCRLCTDPLWTVRRKGIQ
jgi:hypothetical protein